MLLLLVSNKALNICDKMQFISVNVNRSVFIIRNISYDHIGGHRHAGCCQSIVKLLVLLADVASSSNGNKSAIGTFKLMTLLVVLDVHYLRDFVFSWVSKLLKALINKFTNFQSSGFHSE